MEFIEDKQNLIMIALGVAVVVLGVLLLSGGSVQNALSAQEASEKAVAYINEKLLGPGATAALIGDAVEENGIYKFTFGIGDQEFSSYVTKDGNVFFPEAFDLSGEVEGTEETNGQETPAEQAEPSEQAELNAFVVSYCPFGLQMQRIIVKVAEELPELAENINIKYIGWVENGEVQAMHGKQEADENLRQICIREEQEEKFLPYLSCFLTQGKVDECLEETKIDESELDDCIETPNRGVAYAQKDFDEQAVYGVSGSPTMILNGVRASEFDFGGRTADAVKQLLCSGFLEVPEDCSTELSTDDASTGFSETYSGAGSSGSCD